MASIRGGCHCGRIRFEVDADLERVSVCNCSICQRTGYLHWTVAPERVRILAGDGEWTSYRFGTRVAEHRFCPTCGISPFRIARSDPEQLDLNARCLEGVDVDSLAVERFDGRHWEAAYEARERAHGMARRNERV
jgi:hypothetical protein